LALGALCCLTLRRWGPERVRGPCAPLFFLARGLSPTNISAGAHLAWGGPLPVRRPTSRTPLKQAARAPPSIGPRAYCGDESRQKYGKRQGLHIAGDHPRSTYFNLRAGPTFPSLGGPRPGPKMLVGAYNNIYTIFAPGPLDRGPALPPPLILRGHGPRGGPFRF
jgi:hypothetical protein